MMRHTDWLVMACKMAIDFKAGRSIGDLASSYGESREESEAMIREILITQEFQQQSLSQMLQSFEKDAKRFRTENKNR